MVSSLVWGGQKERYMETACSRETEQTCGGGQTSRGVDENVLYDRSHIHQAKFDRGTP